MTHQDNQRFFEALMEMEQDGDVEPIDPALEDRLVSSVLAQRRREMLRRRSFMVAGVVSMAAVLALVFGLKQQTEPTVPLYALHVAGDDKMLGSPTQEETLQLSLDSMLRVELRPADQTTADVVTLAFIRTGETLKRWPVEPARQRSGVFLLRAPAQELGLELGRHDLVFALGPKGHQPSPASIDEALRRGAPKFAGGWQLLRRSVEIVSR